MIAVMAVHGHWALSLYSDTKRALYKLKTGDIIGDIIASISVVHVAPIMSPGSSSLYSITLAPPL